MPKMSYIGKTINEDFDTFTKPHKGYIMKEITVVYFEWILSHVASIICMHCYMKCIICYLLIKTLNNCCSFLFSYNAQYRRKFYTIKISS